MRAAIYARISLDKDGGGQGVERQLEDCRQFLAAKGWTLVEEYVDNDISAFSGRTRPAYERMLQANVDTVVVWKSDRLARRGKDLQRFLDTGMTLTSVTEPEFTGSTGLLMLRILSGFAEHESGVKSERVARKMRQKAERGDPPAGGRRCFGFSADGRSLVAPEAARIREAARRILSGETLSGVLADWRVKGGPGSHFTPGNLSRLLRSPRVAGVREVGGQLVPGTFPAILDLDTWKRLCAVLGRKKPGGPPRTHLLSGLLVCGLCGAKLSGGPEGYKCGQPVNGGCGRIGIRGADTDDYVTRMALAAIPDRKVEKRGDDEVELLLYALRQAEADEAQLAKDHYVEKRISRPAYLAANDELASRCELLRTQIAEHTNDEVASLPDLVERWEEHPVSLRQAVLRTVLEAVVVRPAGSTRAPVESRLELRWRA